jgi:hypothetical protein
VGELSKLGIGICPRNFVRKTFHLFGQAWIGTYGPSQTVAKCVSGGMDASRHALWAGTGLGILAVCLDSTFASQAASFACILSISSHSPSSTSCTARSSA